MAEDLAQQTSKNVNECFTLLDTTFTTFAKLFAMVDLGMADKDMTELASQWNPTWEEHEHLSRKIQPIIAQLSKDIPHDLLTKRRIIPTYVHATVITDAGATNTLQQLCNSSNRFLQHWFTMRHTAATLGSQVLTSMEHRRIVSQLKHDPAYCTTTSLRAIIEARSLKPPNKLLHHPLIDKLLTEEELHVASRFNGPTLLDDLTSYLCELLVRPTDLDALADLAYNPDFYDWWLLNPSSLVNTH